MYRSRGRGSRGGAYGSRSAAGSYGSAPTRENYNTSYTTRSFIENSGYASQRSAGRFPDDPPPADYPSDYPVNRPYYGGASSMRNTVRSRAPIPRQVERDPYPRRGYEEEPYPAARAPARVPPPRSRPPPRRDPYERVDRVEEYHSRKRPPPASRSEPHARKRRDTRHPPNKRPPPAKRGPVSSKRPPKRMEKLPPRSVSKRNEKKKTPAKKQAVKKKEEKKKHITHDMKLRSVIFASGTPGKDEQHDFLVSRNHNHPAIGCIPRVKLGENDWYFVLEVSEHEKDRRRKYSRSSNRGICRWKLLKNDILSIRTFEGISVTDPGPTLDFSNAQTTAIDGTKDVPISIDDSDGPEEGKEKGAEKAADDNSPPTESIVVEAATEDSEVIAVDTSAAAEGDVEMVEEEVVEEVIEEPDDLDPEKLESLKVTELREKCKERDLYAKGLKRELVSRLKEYLVEKAKRIEQQKAKQTAETAESSDVFPDANEEDDDDIIVEEPEKPAEAEKEGEEEKAEEKVLSDDSGEEAAEGEKERTQEKASEDAAEGEEAAEPMEVEENAAPLEEPDDQEVELALIEVAKVDEKLSGICTVINEVQNEGSAYWFVPDLTLVESWQGNEEELKQYTDKIATPMSFTQVKAQIEDATLDTEEKIVEAVTLIFKNAREFNEEGNEWFVNAMDVEKDFVSRYENLKVERELTEVGEDGKLKYAELPEEILKRIISEADMQAKDDANIETLALMAEESLAKLATKKSKFDEKEFVIAQHRKIRAEAERLASDPSSKNNAFYVAMALNHELRQIHHDRDIISSSHTEKTRMLIFEFRRDISFNKLDQIKGHWIKLMKEGPAKGIEKKSVFGEEPAEFEALMTKLTTESNEFYKKEKRQATTEELIHSNKKLRTDKSSLERRLKERTEENRALRKALEDINRLSEYRKIRKTITSSSRA